MPEANLLDEVIHQDQLSCLISPEALQDVCGEVCIMVRFRHKHHCRIHKGGILTATRSPMAPEVASSDEAVAINAHLHIVCTLRPAFQEQRVPVEICRLATIFYDGHVVLVDAVPPEALHELCLETQYSTVHHTVCIHIGAHSL